MAITLNKKQKDVLDSINLEQCDSMIRHKLKHCWNNCFTSQALSNWLQNFSGQAFDVEYEKILAKELLSHFVYFSHREIVHLCQVLYQRIKHYLASCSIDINNVSFYPIGNPSESSSILLYFFRTANNLRTDCFYYSPTNANKTSMHIFIDDICATGDQASEYLTRIRDENKIDSNFFMYYCIISTNKAREKFEQSGLQIDSIYTIDNRMTVTAQQSYTSFSHEKVELIKILLEAYKDISPFAPYGYDNSCLALGFYYNTPDNTLPLFWSDSEKWVPIFRRFEKNYDRTKLEMNKIDCRFI